MQNKHQHQYGSSPERDETLTHILTAGTTTMPLEEQRYLDYLLATGFSHNEAIQLVHQRVHLYENSEMRQRVHDDARIQFARWLFEQGEISS